jgi:hypothetical protein
MAPTTIIIIIIIIIILTARSGYRSSILGRGGRIFPLASVSRPALRPMQHPIQWVPSPGLKRGRGVSLTTHLI